MARVFVTRRIPDAGLAPLREAGLELEVQSSDLPMRRQALLERLAAAPYHALIVTMSERIDAELLEAAGEQLRIVANFAVGYDNIDLSACRARGVAVSNTPDVLSGATAEQAILLMLAVARRLSEGQRLIAAGEWRGWAPLQLLGQGLSGKALGIVGLGRIGLEVARRARGLGMRILYHNRAPRPEAAAELGAVYHPELDTLLRESDVVSLNAPLTRETRHLIGTRELARMKPSAILINTARGPLIDEAALMAALESGEIWGAGLDVYEFEPHISERLKRLPNAVLAPHLGSATTEARAAMARLCAEAVLAVLRGERVPHLLTDEAQGA